MEIIGAIFNFFMQWYIWIPIVLILAFLTWRNYRRAEVVNIPEGDLLILEIPKTNEKKELAPEQMFASLHGILRDKTELRANGGVQEHPLEQWAAL